jgi:uncharacterized membrane protein
MANEITITTQMRRQHATKANDNHTTQMHQKSYTQAATGQDDRKHTIGTSEESISFTDIATNGWVWLYNEDTTNFVDWGFSTGVYGGQMLAGDMAGPFRLKAGATLYLKADTAACKVRIVHYER